MPLTPYEGADLRQRADIMPRCIFFKFVLALGLGFPYIIPRTAWGRSSAGRALDWQSRGQGFDPPRLHPRL